MSSLIVEATGEVITAMGRAEAETITRKITSELDGIATHWENVVPLIAQAITRQAWAALGYGNVTAWITERFGASLLALPRDVRQPVSLELARVGMSTRAIAQVTGVSDATAWRNTSTASHEAVDPHPEPITDPAPAQWASATDALTQLHDAAAQADPGHTIGLNGKTYERPASRPKTTPAAPHRRPLADGFRDATLDLDKLVARLERLVNDDRYPQNAEKVARHAHDLLNAAEALQRLGNQMSNTK